jgi:signal transduction histidine kinase
VFLNILINASQAIQEKGTITLSTYEDGQNIYIKFKDTGSGIPPGVLPKIFDPFFSTKKGTGLGLSVSYNIIKHHAGQIQVESQVGTGTTFTVLLPKAKEIK